jgi:CRP/FNR family transcriptional regulator, cyclic AMP receptor protein
MDQTHYLPSREELIERLKKLPFLKSFEKPHLTKLITSSKIRTYQPGEKIIIEGTFDHWIFIILSGKVAVTKKGQSITELEGTGELFGEAAVLNNELRSATVEAVTTTYCFAIDLSNINEMPSEDRQFIYSIIYGILADILAARLRTTTVELAKAREEIETLRGLLSTLQN